MFCNIAVSVQWMYMRVAKSDEKSREGVHVRGRGRSCLTAPAQHPAGAEIWM